MSVLKDRNKRQDIRRELYTSLQNEGLAIPTGIKMLRKVLALNQAEFAKLVGLSLSTLRRIEQQQGDVTLSSIERILAKFSLELVLRQRSRQKPP